MECRTFTFKWMSITLKPLPNEFPQCWLSLSLPGKSLCISQYNRVLNLVSVVTSRAGTLVVMRIMSTSNDCSYHSFEFRISKKKKRKKRDTNITFHLFCKTQKQKEQNRKRKKKQGTSAHGLQLLVFICVWVFIFQKELYHKPKCCGDMKASGKVPKSCTDRFINHFLPGMMTDGDRPIISRVGLLATEMTAWSPPASSSKTSPKMLELFG